jgi:hypothetical protein
MKKYPSIILTLMLFYSHAFGQVKIHEIWDTNTNSRIVLTHVIGDWYSSDSIKSRISFIRNGNSNVFIEGKRDGVNNYHFKLDSDSIYVNGLAANWPPYYCTLYFHTINTLEIKYYQFHSLVTTSVIYKRKQND